MVKRPDRDIKSIAVSYLWDLPRVVEEPRRLLEAIERYKKKKANAIDLCIVSLLKARLPQTEEGRHLYKEFFDEDPPQPVSVFIPPDELVDLLKQQ